MLTCCIVQKLTLLPSNDMLAFLLSPSQHTTCCTHNIWQHCLHLLLQIKTFPILSIRTLPLPPQVHGKGPGYGGVMTLAKTPQAGSTKHCSMTYHLPGTCTHALQCLRCIYINIQVVAFLNLHTVLSACIARLHAACQPCCLHTHEV